MVGDYPQLTPDILLGMNWRQLLKVYYRPDGETESKQTITPYAKLFRSTWEKRGASEAEIQQRWKAEGHDGSL